MTLPKTAVLLLRGLEGCGVTSYARHFQAYFRDNDGECDVFVLKGKKKVGRPETSSDLNFTTFTFSEKDEVVKKINDGYDLVMVFSVPPTSSEPEVVETYVETFLQRLTPRKVFINHDHSSISFSRNADYKRAIEACDITLCHSLKKTPRGFITWMEKNDVNVEIDKLDVFFHVPLVEDLITTTKKGRLQKVICAGRSASWKRTELAFRLHPYIRDKGFISEVIGYERSIGVYQILNEYDEIFKFWVSDDLGNGKHHKIPSANASPKFNEAVYAAIDREGQVPEIFYCVGGYVYFTGLKRIAQSAFAIHGRTFEFNGLDYGDNMEYQTLECALLSVPIAHRHFLNTVVVPGTDQTLASTGVFLQIDDDNKMEANLGPNLVEPEKLVSQMVDVWESGYTRARKNSVELIRDHYSSDALVPVMLERVL